MHQLTFTIDRFERGKAVLKSNDGQELILSKRQLPARIKEGSVLIAELFLADDAQNRRENIARYLLKEILTPNGTN